jgi:two-component system, NarL family, sensor histidine kinase DevS
MALDLALLGHAVEQSPDGVLIVDGAGTIQYANSSIGKLAGYPDGSLVGMNVDALVPRAVRSKHATLRASYEAAPTQRPMGSGLALSLQREDGSLVPVEISLSPLQHGDEHYVIAAVRDVTERMENQRRLARANEQLALLDERERIGRDLHDVVLQHLYGMGLTVQAVAARADGPTSGRLERVVDEIDQVIAEVRTIVFTLGTANSVGSLGQELADVMAQASRVLGFTPSLRLEGPVESALADDVRGELVTTMREALSNVARHAKATHAAVVVALTDGHVTLTVTDNGVGPPEAPPGKGSGGHGLPSLRARASAFGGACTLQAANPGGAVLRWTVPYTAPDAVGTTTLHG